MSVVSSRNSLPRTILIVHHIHVAYSRHSSNLETGRKLCPKWGRPGLIHHMISVAAYVTKVESLVRPRNTLWSGLIDQGIWSHSIFLGQTRGSASCTPHLEISYCSLRSEWHKLCDFYAAPSRNPSECCVPSELDFKGAGGSVVATLLFD